MKSVIAQVTRVAAHANSDFVCRKPTKALRKPTPPEMLRAREVNVPIEVRTLMIG